MFFSQFAKMSKNKGLIKQGWGGLKLPDFKKANDFWLLDPVCRVLTTSTQYTLQGIDHLFEMAI